MPFYTSYLPPPPLPVCCQPTELIWAFCFINCPVLLPLFVFVFLSSGFCLVLVFVIACFFFGFVFQMIRFIISTFTPIFFIEISFVLFPLPAYRRMIIIFNPPDDATPCPQGEQRNGLICSPCGYGETTEFAGGRYKDYYFFWRFFLNV